MNHREAQRDGNVVCIGCISYHPGFIFILCRRSGDKTSEVTDGANGRLCSSTDLFPRAVPFTRYVSGVNLLDYRTEHWRDV
jgi:hypothetical protein